MSTVRGPGGYAPVASRNAHFMTIYGMENTM